MAAGSGSHGRRGSGELLAVGRGREGSARHGEAPGGVDFTGRTATATNRRRVGRRWRKGGGAQSRARCGAAELGHRRLGRAALKVWSPKRARHARRGRPAAAAWTPGRVRHGHWPRLGSGPRWAKAGRGWAGAGRDFGLGPLGKDVFFRIYF
jgi:hypothetical protein